MVKQDEIAAQNGTIMYQNGLACLHISPAVCHSVLLHDFITQFGNYIRLNDAISFSTWHVSSPVSPTMHFIPFWLNVTHIAKHFLKETINYIGTIGQIAR